MRREHRVADNVHSWSIAAAQTVQLEFKSRIIVRSQHPPQTHCANSRRKGDMISATSDLASLLKKREPKRLRRLPPGPVGTSMLLLPSAVAARARPSVLARWARVTLNLTSTLRSLRRERWRASTVYEHSRQGTEIAIKQQLYIYCYSKKKLNLVHRSGPKTYHDVLVSSERRVMYGSQPELVGHARVSTVLKQELAHTRFPHYCSRRERCQAYACIPRCDSTVPTVDAMRAPCVSAAATFAPSPSSAETTGTQPARHAKKSGVCPSEFEQFRSARIEPSPEVRIYTRRRVRLSES